VQNAASIAGMLLTTETLVVEKPEEEKALAANGHGHSHPHKGTTGLPRPQ
jgi:chaperonin GroEL